MRNWLQVRPGETLTCNGCHTACPTAQNPRSHGRQGLFGSPSTRVRPAARVPSTTLACVHANAGETMAQARARTELRNGTPVQADHAERERYCIRTSGPIRRCARRIRVHLRYSDACIPRLTTPVVRRSRRAARPAGSATCRIVINYPKHIQPLWDVRARRSDRDRLSCWRITPARGRCHTTTPARRPTAPPGACRPARSHRRCLRTRSRCSCAPIAQLLFATCRTGSYHGRRLCTTGWCPTGSIRDGQPDDRYAVGPLTECRQRQWRAVRRVLQPLCTGLGQHACGLPEPGRACACFRSGWILERSISTTRSTRRLRSQLGRCCSSALARRCCSRSCCYALAARAAARASCCRCSSPSPTSNCTTGPGRGYPVFHVVQREASVDVLFRRTDWFKVRDERGVEGWAAQRDMRSTLLADGIALHVQPGRPRRLHLARLRTGHLRRRLRRRHADLRLRLVFVQPQLAVELTGRSSSATPRTATVADLGLTHVFVPEWRLSPFLMLGTGHRAHRAARRRSCCRSTAPTRPPTSGGGVRFYLTRRFFVRAEYRSHMVFTSRNDNEEVDEWKLGFAFFF